MLSPGDNRGVNRAGVERRRLDAEIEKIRAKTATDLGKLEEQRRKLDLDEDFRPQAANRPWQCLYFLPEPQGQGSLRPTLPQLDGSFGSRVSTGIVSAERAA